MQAQIKYKLGGSDQSEEKEVRHVIIWADGSKFTITYNPVYGLVVNKINHKDDGTDTLSVSPRTSNEIQLK